MIIFWFPFVCLVFYTSQEDRENYCSDTSQNGKEMHGNFEIATLPGFLLGMGDLGFACGFSGEEEQSH